ncbi:MAG: tetratricopeptide repeat protein [Cyclobacteriaceae bacterium]
MNRTKPRIILLALSLALVVMATIPSLAQTTEVSEQDKYQLALRYGDMDVAKNVLYHRISAEPNNLGLLDTLAMLYFDYQKYTSCILVCRDILSANPDNFAALEMSALSFENLGLKDKALSNYESMYLKKNNKLVLYKMAALQFELKRYIESSTNLDILLKNAKSDDQQVTFSTGASQISVPLQAAVHNLKGLIKQEEGDKAAAKQSFESALEVHPDFSFAKENLKKLEEN